MLGILFKILFVAALVGAVGFGVIWYRQGGNLQSVLTSVNSVDVASLSGRISQGLDSLVSRGNSPVVLGIQITDDSLNSVVDTLQNLPPDQLQEIRRYICQPASSSAD